MRKLIITAVLAFVAFVFAFFAAMYLSILFTATYPIAALVLVTWVIGWHFWAKREATRLAAIQVAIIRARREYEARKEMIHGL